LRQVFISYKCEDLELAKLVESRLEVEDFKVWMDGEIHAGTEWRKEIDKEIKKSIALIVIMTPAAKESEYVTYEWAFACGAGIRVIPLMFESVKLHPRLEVLQYRDFRNDDLPWGELINDLYDAESSQLTIHHAVWAAKDKWNDVTCKVNEEMSAGNLDMDVCIDTLGEPAKGERKMLFVVYSYQGKVNLERIEEDGKLILPK